jgi:cytochrome c oxidase assembly protein subunit 15
MSSGIIASSGSRVEIPPKGARLGMAPIAGFAWATLACNVAVVLWGAYVRATGSGAGCGNKWPVCGGVVLGEGARAQTIIEFIHRLTSGIALLMVGVLVVWCCRVTAKRDWARYSAILSGVFLANEAVLGAALVLLGHVAQDKSSGRILFLCLHFGNTLLLLAMLTLTAWSLRSVNRSFRLIRKPRHVIVIGTGLFATMLIGITGAVAALGDTLFPATSLRSSLAQDFSFDAPALLHLRLVHPIVATIASAYVLWVIFNTVLRQTRPSGTAIALVTLFCAQIVLGIVNVLLLAPVWLQILHLCLADVLWIVLVIVSADLLLEPAKGPVTAAG